MFNSANGASLVSLMRKPPNRNCQPVKRDVLRQRLGNAYNHRYMAVDDTHLPSTNGNQDLTTKHVNVTKRSSPSSISQIKDSTPWTCQTKKIWKNLGSNYFPRHVRSVTCSSSTCWFGHFRCKPQYYTIKVLKKKLGECLRIYSASGIPSFEDFWETQDYTIAVACMCGH